MNEPPRKARFGVAGWIALVVLGAFLIAAIVYARDAWRAMGGVELSGRGWVVLIGGGAITILVGAVLMGLIFYSSRHGHDR